MEGGNYLAYAFAEDTAGGPFYHVAFFRGSFDEDSRETFLHMDHFSRKPIKTIRELGLTLDLLAEKYRGCSLGRSIYINGVPEMFSRNKSYRHLYFFEEPYNQIASSLYKKATKRIATKTQKTIKSQNLKFTKSIFVPSNCPIGIMFHRA